MATSPNDPQPRTARKRFADRPAPIGVAPLTMLADAGETCVGDTCELPGTSEAPDSAKPSGA